MVQALAEANAHNFRNSKRRVLCAASQRAAGSEQKQIYKWVRKRASGGAQPKAGTRPAIGINGYSHRQCKAELAADNLFFEQVVERFAGVVGAIGRGAARRLLGGLSGGRGRGRVLFNRGAERIKGAIVPRIFFGDALRNRLSAFELLSGVEVHALFARVQLEPATRTLRIRIESGLQYRPTIGAARAGDGPNHPGRARSNLFLARAMLLRAFLFLLGAV